MGGRGLDNSLGQPSQPTGIWRSHRDTWWPRRLRSCGEEACTNQRRGHSTEVARASPGAPFSGFAECAPTDRAMLVSQCSPPATQVAGANAKQRCPPRIRLGSGSTPGMGAVGLGIGSVSCRADACVGVRAVGTPSRSGPRAPPHVEAGRRPVCARSSRRRAASALGGWAGGARLGSSHTLGTKSAPVQPRASLQQRQKIEHMSALVPSLTRLTCSRPESLALRLDSAVAQDPSDHPVPRSALTPPSDTFLWLRSRSSRYPRLSWISRPLTHSFLQSSELPPLLGCAISPSPSSFLGCLASGRRLTGISLVAHSNVVATHRERPTTSCTAGFALAFASLGQLNTTVLTAQLCKCRGTSIARRPGVRTLRLHFGHLIRSSLPTLDAEMSRRLLGQWAMSQMPQRQLPQQQRWKTKYATAVVGQDPGVRAATRELLVRRRSSLSAGGLDFESRAVRSPAR